MGDPNGPGGQGDAQAEAVWRDRGQIIYDQQTRIAQLERECLDREATEADARSQLAVAGARIVELEAKVASPNIADLPGAKQSFAYGVPVGEIDPGHPIIMTTYDGTAKKYARWSVSTPWTEDES